MGKLFDDKPPKAVGGIIMRRTDEHIKKNSSVSFSRSGDRHLKPPMKNTHLDTYPDDANNWGKTPLDDDWEDE